MRISRINKKRNKKLFSRNVLLLFLIIIPAAAVISSFVIYFSLNRDKGIDLTTAFTAKDQAVNTFKYKFDINAKQFFRVEIKKYEKYEDAETQIAMLKKKKLNGFIVKEQGYLVAYGLFINESQANTAVKYLKRKGIESSLSIFNVNGANIKYDDMDNNLVDIASAVDTAALKILNEKAALSLESLYSGKAVSEKSLEIIIEQEERLIIMLNYLKDVKTSDNIVYKESLEILVNELLVDKLGTDRSYDYYKLQNSLMNQGEALRKFYNKLLI